MEGNKENKKLTTIIICCILTLIAAIAGATYAYFSIRITSNEYITGTTGVDADSLKLDIVLESSGTGKLIPQIDSTIEGAASGSSGKDKCIDSNDNTVCKVYSITIINQSPYKMNVTGKLQLFANYIEGIEDSMPNLKWALGKSATTGFPTPSGAYYTKNDTYLGDTALEASGFEGDRKTFYVAIWISESNDVQTDTGQFTGSVSFDGYVISDDGIKNQGITSTFGG